MTKTVILPQIKKPNCILQQGGVQFHHQTKLEKLDIERQFPWQKCHLPLSNKVTWKPTLFSRRLQFRPPLKMMKCPWKYWNIIHASVSKSCITQLLQLINSFEINQTICGDKLSYCVTMALWSSVKNLHKVSLIVK